MSETQYTVTYVPYAHYDPDEDRYHPAVHEYRNDTLVGSQVAIMGFDTPRHAMPYARWMAENLRDRDARALRWALNQLRRSDS